MPENNRIENTFEYDIPDQYLYQTNTLKKKGTWTYVGPDKIWIFVNNETKKIISRFHYTERDDGANVPTPPGETKILIDATIDPLIASIVYNEIDYGLLDHTEELLPNDTKYGYPVNIPPDHTYELTEMLYDFDNQEFVKPYPWKKPHVTWDDIRTQRLGLLAASDYQIKNCRPEDIDAWSEYRQLLRDLPDAFDGIDAWKVSMPVEPGKEPPTFTTGSASQQIGNGE